MTEQDLTDLLQAAFPGAQITGALDGGHVDITVVSADFEGLRPVARQQRCREYRQGGVFRAGSGQDAFKASAS